MSVTAEDVRKVAKLARLAVEEEQIPALTSELNGILAMVEQLQEVDVDGVEPMTSVSPMRLKRREDGVTDGDKVEQVLANAPETAEGFFVVPKVVE
ncbi:MAG: Asp-tRNA(Asn)/Glu-tRNA(Gln) amidotransferase subunit GatC [Neomegalonema sp.]|nr:Asp-tRNA(Asn)/Glu-tRNA(Gln) amidotransferase subunit GatC [Neomegalonema sp.]